MLCSGDDRVIDIFLLNLSLEDVEWLLCSMERYVDFLYTVYVIHFICLQDHHKESLAVEFSHCITLLCNIHALVTCLFVCVFLSMFGYLCLSVFLSFNIVLWTACLCLILKFFVKKFKIDY